MNTHSFRLTLFVAASASALLAGAASAQTAAPQDEPTAIDEVVVTGTRAPNRSRLDTLAPSTS